MRKMLVILQGLFFSSLNRNSYKYTSQAMLSGCSAGGLASMLHCDNFRAIFPGIARVKCLADGGFFIDV